MQIKKSLLALGLATFLTTAFADGFYVGAGLGADHTTFKQNYTVPGEVVEINPDHFIINPAITYKSNVGNTGVMGSVFAGYGLSFGNLYLGTEINTAANTVKSENTSIYFQPTNSPISEPAVSLTTSYKIKNNYGISILPGFKLSEQSLIYVRLGYIKGKAEFEYKNSGLNSSNTDKTNLNGTRYGVGLQTEVVKNVNLRLEYNHIDYKTYKARNFINGVDFNFHPCSDLAEIGISYAFS